jgi:hypothetical protein
VARLAEELGAVVLNKDTVRAALFPPPVLDYSAGQDDISTQAIYYAAYTLANFVRQPVLPKPIQSWTLTTIKASPAVAGVRSRATALLNALISARIALQ